MAAFDDGSNHVGPLWEEKIIELVVQEEVFSFAINSFFPPTPSTIHYFLQVIGTGVVRIKN